MKKLMFTAAAAAAGLAFGTGLESANTVGYQTISVEKESWALLGASFEGTDGNAMNVNDLIKGTFVATDDAGTAPILQTWNGSGLVSYYYLNDDATFEGDGWADGTGTIVNLTVPAGAGFWLYPNASTTLTFSR